MANYEAVIKVNVDDSREARARAIEEGIGYACALLVDEYGRTPNEVLDVLYATIDGVYDQYDPAED